MTTLTLTPVDIGTLPCELCGGSGVIRVAQHFERGEYTGDYRIVPPHMSEGAAHDEFRYPVWNIAGDDCPCRKRQRALTRLENMISTGRIDKRITSYTLADFLSYPNARGAKTAVDFAEQLIQSGEVDGKPGLLLTGANGTGKSSLTYCVFREAVERGEVAVWLNWNVFLDEVRWSYEDGYTGPPLMELKKPALKAKWLVIDDLGSPTRGSKPYAEDAVDALRDITEVRYNLHLPTVITSNLLEDQLRAQFGERDFSRIIGLCHPVLLAGRDLRK